MGKRTSAPGYRYANERLAYLALTPEQRAKVKEWMEQVWNDKSCEAVHKNRVPCPVKNDKKGQQ